MSIRDAHRLERFARLFTTILLLLCAAPAAAQYVQYTPPGSLGAPVVPYKELLDRALEDARWRMGPFRLAPWGSVKDVAYINNVYGASTDPKSDVTTTLGAGLRGYLRTNQGLVLAVHALPEYVFWFDLENRRKLNGRYGAGVFGYLRRLTLEAEATASEQQSYVSSELEQPINLSLDRLSASAEFAVKERFLLFGKASIEDWGYEQPTDGEAPNSLVLLARRENILRAGFRYRFSGDFTLGLGVERSLVDFDQVQGDRSNQGTSPVLEVSYRRPHGGLDVSAAYRSLSPRDGSAFVDFDGVTGRFLVSIKPGSRLEAQFYGVSNLVYSIAATSPYYEDRRLGAAANVELGWRIVARSFFEKGGNYYRMYDPSAQPRVDDVSAYGGGVTIKLGEKLFVIVRGSRESYDSNSPGADRSIFRLQTAVTFGASNSPWF